jgi:SulP family sulfate permease
LILKRFFPFLRWFPYRSPTFRADLLAGLTVALVLIPQSMAYAQLAGLPAYFGLYAAFLPVAVAALWGSSNQLGSGPVAVVSLLTASTLAPLAQPGTETYIALAILLALTVGLVQLTLGIFKLGVIVNFLSHPVIVGFTNAAALIIAMSQVSKLFGLSMPNSGQFLVDFWGVLSQWRNTHLPTLALGVLAIGLMWGLKKYKPKVPGVLVAVALTTLISWGFGFENNVNANLAQIKDPALLELVRQVDEVANRVKDLGQEQTRINGQIKAIQQDAALDKVALIRAQGELAIVQSRIGAQNAQSAQLRKQLAQIEVVREVDSAGATTGIYAKDKAPTGARLQDTSYHVRGVSNGAFRLQGGGEVVGRIPQGLPELKIPDLSLGSILSLLASAVVISLVGFMEAISIAKAIAAKTRQRIDPNQELIGQGLANLVGSFSQSYPISGSFSRSAVNSNSGALTGMSSVFTALIVLVALLFLTPLLYHLPQAVLGAIIIMAVTGLINVSAVKHAWQASRHDGMAALVTFVATLAFAPHLDSGIMVGTVLALGLYLYRTMTPRVAVLGRHSDGTLRDTLVYPDIPTGKQMVAVRFDGSLYFANVSYFEDAVLGAVASQPDTKVVLIVANGINQLDASGEEVIHHLLDRLKDSGVSLVFSGLKKQVLDVMRATGLYDAITESNLFATEDLAIAEIYKRMGQPTEGDAFVNQSASAKA